MANGLLIVHPKEESNAGRVSPILLVKEITFKLLFNPHSKQVNDDCPWSCRYGNTQY